MFLQGQYAVTSTNVRRQLNLAGWHSHKKCSSAKLTVSVSSMRLLKMVKVSKLVKVNISATVLKHIIYCKKLRSDAMLSHDMHSHSLMLLCLLFTTVKM